MSAVFENRKSLTSISRCPPGRNASWLPIWFGYILCESTVGRSANGAGVVQDRARWPSELLNIEQGRTPLLRDRHRKGNGKQYCAHAVIYANIATRHIARRGNDLWRDYPRHLYLCRMVQSSYCSFYPIVPYIWFDQKFLFNNSSQYNHFLSRLI